MWAASSSLHKSVTRFCWCRYINACLCHLTHSLKDGYKLKLWNMNLSLKLQQNGSRCGGVVNMKSIPLRNIHSPHHMTTNYRLLHTDIMFWHAADRVYTDHNSRCNSRNAQRWYRICLPAKSTSFTYIVASKAWLPALTLGRCSEHAVSLEMGMWAAAHGYCYWYLYLDYPDPAGTGTSVYRDKFSWAWWLKKWHEEQNRVIFFT